MEWGSFIGWFLCKNIFMGWEARIPIRNDLMVRRMESGPKSCRIKTMGAPISYCPILHGRHHKIFGWAHVDSILSQAKNGRADCWLLRLRPGAAIKKVALVKWPINVSACWCGTTDYKSGERESSSITVVIEYLARPDLTPASRPPPTKPWRWRYCLVAKSFCPYSIFCRPQPQICLM